MRNKTPTHLNSDEGRKIELALYRKGLDNFIQTIVTGTKAELDFELTKLAKANEMLTNTQNKDEELTRLKNKVKELNKPYTEQKTANKKLMRFIALVLQDRYGDNLGLATEESVD